MSSDVERLDGNEGGKEWTQETALTGDVVVCRATIWIYIPSLSVWSSVLFRVRISRPSVVVSVTFEVRQIPPLVVKQNGLLDGVKKNRYSVFHVLQEEFHQLPATPETTITITTTTP